MIWSSWLIPRIPLSLTLSEGSFLPRNIPDLPFWQLSALSGDYVCWVHLSVYVHDCSKSNEEIFMKILIYMGRAWPRDEVVKFWARSGYRKIPNFQKHFSGGDLHCM